MDKKLFDINFALLKEHYPKAELESRFCHDISIKDFPMLNCDVEWVLPPHMIIKEKHSHSDFLFKIDNEYEFQLYLYEFYDSFIILQKRTVTEDQNIFLKSIKDKIDNADEKRLLLTIAKIVEDFFLIMPDYISKYKTLFSERRIKVRHALLFEVELVKEPHGS